MNESKTLLHKNTFSKDERLCSNKQIDELFTSGESFISYPLRVVYRINEGDRDKKERASILISVSKKKFKRAVKRNRVKRLARESYRINKLTLNESLTTKNLYADIAFLFLKNELPDFAEIEKAMLKALSQLTKKINDKVNQ